jgi:uncharacterized membrane protein YhhN
VLSLAADIAHLAEGSEALVVGMGLSLVANLCLALAFIGLGLQAWSSLPGLLVFGTASVWLGGRLWPRVNPGLRGPLAANLVALSCMAAAVYSGLSGHMLLELAVVAALGATLLYFSHALLAWSRFRAPLAHAQALVLTSYWAGQLCIVLAARWGAGA